MTVSISGTSGIVNDATDLNYTGTLTGGTGVVNLGSGQVYKDASGNVGIGTSSPATNLQVTNTSATTNATVTPVTVQAMTSGTAANGFGSSVEFNAEASDGASYAQTTISSIWTDATAATRSSALTFATRTSAGAITERARIDSSGNLLVGTTSPSPGYGNTNTGVQISGSGSTFSRAANDYVMVVNQNTADGSSYYQMVFRVANVTKGSIISTSTATSYNTSSDYRLKEDIAPMTGALARVAALKPCTYKWKVDGSDGQGFIAHELAEVEAGCVTGEKDAVDAEGNPQYQGIDTSFLVATLTAAIQELKAIVDTQAISITALNERLTALEAPIV